MKYLKSDKNVFIIPARFSSIIDKIRNVAQKEDYDVYIVGGFVRDIILKRDPKDLDILAIKK